eukprot:COSAG01_NODE_11623_length_1893_cov_1.449833_1_plen_328_part_10
MLGMDYKDPVRTGIDDAFGRTAWKKQLWDSKYCQTSTASQEYCDIIFKTSAENALGLPEADATAYNQTFPLNTDPKVIFGDCTVSAGAGCVTSTLQEDKAYCSTADLNKDLVTSRTNCLAKKLGTNGCKYLPGNGTVGVNKPLKGEACVPAPDCNAAVGLLGTCLQCAKHCRESLIADTKENLEPASYVVFLVLLFCFICILVNDFVVDAEFEGLWNALSWVFNGVVALSGLIISAMSAVGHFMLTEDCPDGADCSNVAVYFVILLGLGLLVTGILGLIGTWKQIGIFMKKVNILMACVSLLLLLAGLFLAIVGGSMDTINARSEEHF